MTIRVRNQQHFQVLIFTRQHSNKLPIKSYNPFTKKYFLNFTEERVRKLVNAGKNYVKVSPHEADSIINIPEVIQYDTGSRAWSESRW